jgi:tetratricopeptide (TPR) repeat protein
MVGSGRRARAWWWRSALAALAGIATLECSSSEPPCQQAVLDRAWTLAAEQCEPAYRQSRHHDDGIALAKALSALGDHEAAVALATTLLTTPARGAAHTLLATAARDSDELLPAIAHGTAALAMHIASGDDAELFRAAYVLTMTWWKNAWYDAALELADICRVAARRAGDRRAVGYCEMARADAYRMLGDGPAARVSMEAVTESLEAPCDLAWAQLKAGIIQTELKSPAVAQLSFERAIATASRCEPDRVTPAAHANLAWVSRTLRDPEAAEAHLAAIQGDHVENRLLKALLAADRGDLTSAETHLAAAAGLETPDAQWSWYVAHLQALLADERGDETVAITRYERAIELASSLLSRSKESSPYVVATLRGSYEGLFAVHARAGRWNDAFLVIARLDVDDLLRSAAAGGTFGAEGIAPPPGMAPGARHEVRPSEQRAYSADALLAAWAERDLVVAVAPSPREIGGGRERLWLLHVEHGRATGADMGPASAALERARILRGTPLDRAAASTLGRLLIPRSMSSQPLGVLLVGELGSVPLAVLRHDDALIVATRPLVRVLAVTPGPAPGPRRGALVLGDPRRDLPRAAAEASRVAARLGTTAFLHESATAARLASGRSADVVHVSAHVHKYARDFGLHVADGIVRGADIVNARIAPRLAVLASCGSAAARDDGGWGSLAAGFLRAGTDQVVATHWSVGDDAAEIFIASFYEKGGVADPARALAAAQVALSITMTSADWAAFTILAAPPPAAPVEPSNKDTQQ